MLEFFPDTESNQMMMSEIPRNLRELNRAEIFNSSTIEVKKRIKKFDDFVHKGTRGHAAIIAGSEGMMGASILATSACMRSGCGKATAFVSFSDFPIIHQSIPEALVRSTEPVPESYHDFQSIAIGPGLGISNQSKLLLNSTFKANRPLIIDADGLNLIAKYPELKTQIPTNTLLTPHHAEWEKIFFKSDDDHMKIEASMKFCKTQNINILLKGHFSILVTPYNYFINGTGNNGMAKAGSGDVLTGILASLMAQGYNVEDAGIIGMYVHGLAGDFAKEHLGEDYMIATDIIHYLSAAFQSIRN